MPGMDSLKQRKMPSIVLEAFADSELWIWHPLSTSPGSLSDSNVLDPSTTMEKISARLFPPLRDYKVNGR